MAEQIREENQVAPEAAGVGRPGAEGTPYRRHMPALDGVRGIAVLGVMGSHLFYGTASTPLTRVAQATLEQGAAGVDLFFVLSGFLITGILFDSLHDGRFFRKFYARRTLRIFPLYYGVLAVFGCLALFRGRHYDHELLSLALYLQNTSLIAVPIWAYPGQLALPLDHFWSLAVEEQFYLFWPLLVYLLRSKRAILYACVAFSVASVALRMLLWAHGRPFAEVHSMTVCRLDTLLGGGALAMLLRSSAHHRAIRAGKWLVAVGIAMLLVPGLTSRLGVPGSGNTWQFGMTSFGYAIGFTGLLAWTLEPDGVLHRFFSNRVLRVIGKYSYGLYVLHFILASEMRVWLRDMIGAHISSNKLLGVVLNGVIVGLVSFVAAYLSYHVYEKQFLKLKRFWAYRKAEEPV